MSLLMVWPESIAFLAAVGVVTRRILGLSGRRSQVQPLLPGDHERVCRRLKLELEVPSAALAVTLDDAMGARECGQPVLALSTLELASAQWSRQADLITYLLHTVMRYLPLASMSLPMRSLVEPDYYKSDTMRGYLALHYSADQFVFRSKQRFNLHIRMLDQAVSLVTSDFMDAHSGQDRSDDSALWCRVDHDFHDFDLLTKKTILALHDFIGCLPLSALRDFAAEIQPALRAGVRAYSDEDWDA